MDCYLKNYAAIFSHGIKGNKKKKSLAFYKLKRLSSGFNTESFELKSCSCGIMGNTNRSNLALEEQKQALQIVYCLSMYYIWFETDFVIVKNVCSINIGNMNSNSNRNTFWREN